jgi:hypothetical protein
MVTMDVQNIQSCEFNVRSSIGLCNSQEIIRLQLKAKCNVIMVSFRMVKRKLDYRHSWRTASCLRNRRALPFAEHVKA